MGTARPPGEREEPGVHVSVPSRVLLAPGEHGELTVVIQLDQGFHITSDRPSRPEYVATRVELGMYQSSDVTVGEPIYPEAVSFNVGDETVSTFVGTVVVRLPIEVSMDAPAGVREIPGHVRFQACTSGRCLYPETLQIRAVLEVKRD